MWVLFSTLVTDMNTMGHSSICTFVYMRATTLGAPHMFEFDFGNQRFTYSMQHALKYKVVHHKPLSNQVAFHQHLLFRQVKQCSHLTLVVHLALPWHIRLSLQWQFTAAFPSYYRIAPALSFSCEAAMTLLATAHSPSVVPTIQVWAAAEWAGQVDQFVSFR